MRHEMGSEAAWEVGEILLLSRFFYHIVFINDSMHKMKGRHSAAQEMPSSLRKSLSLKVGK